MDKIVKQMIENQLGSTMAPERTDTDILTDFDLDEFREALNSGVDELKCEAKHTEYSGPCSIKVTHRVMQTCDGMSGNICLNAAAYEEYIMFVVHAQCASCKRCAHDCWKMWAI